MTRTLRFIVIVCALLSLPRPTHAVDAVVYWNEIAVPVVSAGRPGPISIVDLALVQAAVNDAVQAIEEKYEPYHEHIPGAHGSPESSP